MTASYQENVSSFDAIINSIKYDIEVCRWFEFFVTQPAIAAELQSDAQMAQAYGDLQKAVFKQRVVLALALISVLAISFLKTYWAFLMIPAVLYYGIRFQGQKKDCVVEISKKVISRDYAPVDSLSSITLFQLSEQYAKKYGIASLVDKIYCVDQVKRYSVLVFLVVVMAVWTVAFSWKAALAMICYYHLIRAGLMTAVVYRHLR